MHERASDSSTPQKFFLFKNYVRDQANLGMQQHFTLAKCKIHPKHAYTTVHEIGMNERLTFELIQ